MAGQNRNRMVNFNGVDYAVSAARPEYFTPMPPGDISGFGSYSFAFKSGVEAAGMTADSPILALRWNPTTAGAKAGIKSVIFSAGNDGTGFTAGSFYFDLFIARSFTAQDTGGAAATMTNGKLNTSHATTNGMTAQVPTTGVLTAGTRTLDANPISTIMGSVPATAGQQIVAPFDMLDYLPGKYPVILAANEGLVIQAKVPATGTWRWSAVVQWDEFAAYPF